MGIITRAVCSGVDFPTKLAELYLDGPPKFGVNGQPDYTIGVRARNLELDILWIAAVLHGRRQYPFLTMPPRVQGVKALLGLLNPAHKFDILSLQDLRPGLAEISKIVRKLGRKIKTA